MESTESILREMNETLVHRGPDGGDVYFENNDSYQIGLGHRRLSIIDLTETGTQPMQFNGIHTIFNGEIYNFSEIKDELTTLGHQFTGNSDTEMILHAYQEWGMSCLHKFIGMFAFCIFDPRKNEVILCRDRAGVKPLYYYVNNDLVLFASELKAFHKHPSFSKEINTDAVAAFMQYGNVPTPHCIFKNTFKLKPGHWLKVNLSNGDMKENQYWNVYDYYNKDKRDISYEEAKDELRPILRSAFEYRMVSDVPVGVFLSGGIDSTCVTSFLQSEKTEKIKTFTIAVPDIGLNEAPYAKDIAAHIGTDHTEIDCTQKEAIELIEQLPYFYDEPYADSSAIPTTLVAKSARKQVTVALSADGGDEIFAGYNRYEFLSKYGRKMNSIPGFLRKSIASGMSVVPAERIPVLRNKYNFHNRYEKLKQILKNPSDKEIMLSLSQQFTDNQVKKLCDINVNILDTYFNSKELLAEHHTQLSYMQAIDYQTYMLDDILTKVDRATMSQSLEGREPFLDQRIIEFAAQLPDEFKYHNGVKKRILRDITYEKVPKELLDRPKMGFAIPIAEWLTNELREHVEDHINEKNIREQGIFNWSEIEKIKEKFYGGRKEYDLKIWYLLMFQMWYQKWMVN
jgi:asparagine synthase (glutamine-hydrolysing)